MKKLWFILALCVFVLASCSDGGSEDPANPTPKPEVVTPEIMINSDVLTNGLSFATEAGEKSLSFTTNVDWTLSIASTTGGTTWCKPSVTSGNKGSATVKFTVTEHTDYDDRSVSVTIKAGTASKTFTITQKCAEALLLTTDKYDVAQDGGIIEVEVKANIDYEVVIPETAKSWITTSDSQSRTLTTRKHTFTIAASEEVDKREGEITFKSGDKVETVKVYQAGGPIILLTKNEYNVSDQGETISVDIKSNIDYGIQMPNVNWISEESASRAMSSHTLKYTIATNEDYDSRSTEIVFYDKNSDMTDTLKVIQAQKNAIVISQKNYNIKIDGEIIEVKLSANVEFEVTMPETDWISQVTSRALTEHTLYFKIDKNTSENDRSAEIIFTNKESQVNESIIFFQSGFKGSYANGVATIVKSGTMRELLGEDYLNITSLKVIGSINGTDIRTLREMAGSDVDGNNTNGQLQILDISNCNIVEGGETYIFSKHTTNNIVGANMFQNCSALKELHLPETVTKIDEYAFANCTQLKIFDIPRSVITLEKKLFDGCSSLKDLVIPSNISSWSMLGKTSISNITIENGVKNIPNQAFKQCSDLKKITIPKTVTSIGSEAFTDCTDIREVYVDDLEQWLNYNWEYVRNYGIGSLLMGYKGGILYIGGEKIKEITIPNTYTSIPNYAFYGCTNIEAITLPNTLESIGKLAFGVTSIKQIDIPNSVKDIGEGAFQHCSELEKVTMSNMVTKIPADCFYYCEKLKFQIPSHIQEIDSHAFGYCESLEEITIPNGAKISSTGIFEDCTNVKTITLPSSLTYIGISVFGNIPVEVVYCYAVNPPDLSIYSSGFSGMNFNKNTAILYIPQGCLQAYKDSKWGEYFQNIKEIEE